MYMEKLKSYLWKKKRLAIPQSSKCMTEQKRNNCYAEGDDDDFDENHKDDNDEYERYRKS